VYIFALWAGCGLALKPILFQITPHDLTALGGHWALAQLKSLRLKIAKMQEWAQKLNCCAVLYPRAV
jgi:hypothetical protein